MKISENNKNGKLFETGKKIIRNPYAQALFVAFVVTFFLLPKGIWIYHDNVFLAKSPIEAWVQLHRIFSSLDIADYYSTYWGYDSLYFNVGRILCYPIFLISTIVFHDAGAGQWFHYMVFFSLSYLIFNNFIGLFTKSNFGRFLGAAFVITTQYFLFSYTINGFAFAYAGFPLLVVSLIKVYEPKLRYWNLFTLAVSLYWIMSYQRLFLIYVLVAVILGLIFIRIIVRHWERTLLVLSVLVFTSLPILLALFSTYQDSKAGGGANNYQKFFKLSNGANSFVSQSQTSLFRSFNFSDSGLSFLNLDKGILETAMTVLSCIIGFFVLWFLVKHSKKFYRRVLLGLYLLALFLTSIAHFVSKKTFLKITYDYLPFLANQTNDIRIITLIITGFCVPLIFIKLKNKWYKFGFLAIVVLYAGISSLALFLPAGNKAQLSFEKIPKEYQEEFFSKEDFDSYVSFPTSVAALQDPYGAFFNWFATPIEFNQNIRFKMLGSSNVRLVNLKQATLFNQLLVEPTKVADYNTRFFGLKNVIVYKDVQNPQKNQFVYYNDQHDYESMSKEQLKLFRGTGNLQEVEDTKRFSRFQPTGARNFDYFLYSPGYVVQKSLKDVFLGTEDVGIPKTLILDPAPANMPRNQTADSIFNTISENRDVRVDMKMALQNRGVIYAKISNLNADNPFLLQLNQTYHSQWRIAAISQQTYESVACSNAQNYSESQNSTCRYSGSIVDPNSLKILTAKQIEGNHFEGNGIGNAWLLRPAAFKNQVDDGTMYVAMYYKRQIWYHLGIIGSGIALVVILLIALYQEISYRRKGLSLESSTFESAREYLR